MTGVNIFKNLEYEVDKILQEELKKTNISYDVAKSQILDVKTVGVQGDQKSYAYVAEITLYANNQFVWNENFSAKLSNRITNEIPAINRVVYTIAKKDDTKES